MEEYRDLALTLAVFRTRPRRARARRARRRDRAAGLPARQPCGALEQLAAWARGAPTRAGGGAGEGPAGEGGQPGHGAGRRRAARLARRRRTPPRPRWTPLQAPPRRGPRPERGRRRCASGSPATTCSTWPGRWRVAAAARRADRVDLEMLEGMADGEALARPRRSAGGLLLYAPGGPARRLRRRPSPTWSAASTRTPRRRTSCAPVRPRARARRRSPSSATGSAGRRRRAHTVPPAPRRTQDRGHRAPALAPRRAVRQRARHRLVPSPPTGRGSTGRAGRAGRARRPRCSPAVIAGETVAPAGDRRRASTPPRPTRGRSTATRVADRRAGRPGRGRRRGAQRRLGGAPAGRAGARPATGRPRCMAAARGRDRWRRWPSTPARRWPRATPRCPRPSTSPATTRRRRIELAASADGRRTPRSVSWWWPRRGTSRYAIPAGGVLAALAAGNAVILKPAPETVLTAWLLAEQLWAAACRATCCSSCPAPTTTSAGAWSPTPTSDAVILTGACDTARLFLGWRPDLPPPRRDQRARTPCVVTAAADLDLAVARPRALGLRARRPEVLGGQPGHRRAVGARRPRASCRTPAPTPCAASGRGPGRRPAHASSAR